MQRYSTLSRSFGGVYSCGGWNGGKLAYLLGCSVSFPYNNENRSHSFTQSRHRAGKLPRSINLGCRQKYIEKDCFNWNSQFTQDKIGVFKVFDEAGIPHPRLIDMDEIVSNSTNLPAEFLGRKNNSSRGRGITKYTRDEWMKEFPKGKGTKEGKPAHDFYVEFLHFKSEHRMHVLNGQIVCELNKKVKPDSSNFIHTAEQGSPLEIGTIIHPTKDLMREYAIKAVQACGLDLGAVDIFVDKNDKIYILEVNSDPGMPGPIGYLYAQRFRCMFGMTPLYDYTLMADGKVEKREIDSKKTKKV